MRSIVPILGLILILFCLRLLTNFPFWWLNHKYGPGSAKLYLDSMHSSVEKQEFTRTGLLTLILTLSAPGALLLIGSILHGAITRPGSLSSELIQLGGFAVLLLVIDGLLLKSILTQLRKAKKWFEYTGD